MLTRIDINSENAFYVKILGATPRDSLFVRKITGLSPPDINLFIGDYARDGGIYQGRRTANRNVVLNFDLNPNPRNNETVSGLRELLYRAFLNPRADGDYVEMTLVLDDGRQLVVVGNVEKFESEIFDIATMVQISIICPDPYLRDKTPRFMINPSGWTVMPLTYTGTAETGFEAEIHLNANTVSLTLENNSVTNDTTNAQYPKGRMIFNRQFLENDVVYINTNRGSTTALLASKFAITPDMAVMPIAERWAALVAAGATTPLIGALTPTSQWLYLRSQSNLIKVYGPSSSSPAAIKQLGFTQAYWGI